MTQSERFSAADLRAAEHIWHAHAPHVLKSYVIEFALVAALTPVIPALLWLALNEAGALAPLAFALALGGGGALARSFRRLRIVLLADFVGCHSIAQARGRRS